VTAVQPHRSLNTAGPQRSRKTSTVPPLRGVAPVVLFLCLWQFFGKDNSVFYPRPSSWLQALSHLLHQGILWPAIWSTLTTLASSLVVATLVGAALGYVVGRSPPADRALIPTLEFLRATPAAAVVPVFLVFMGFGRDMTITVVTFASVWPILLNTRTGARALNPVLMDGARSLHLRPWARITKIVLPALMPSIFLGVRVAAPVALVMTLLVEFIVQFYGVGSLIAAAQRDYASAAVYGLVVVAGIFGLGVNSIVPLVEGFCLRNHGPGFGQR
jgi:ABC-type nitrate/sulfonate/bicarbonate transport system permease component